MTPSGARRPDAALSSAAGRDAGGAAVGTDRDVPRERALGGRSHLRPVAGDSAEDVQVRGGEARGLRRDPLSGGREEAGWFQTD